MKPLAGLINAKSMSPKVFHGKTEESYRTWAKKVRAFCNATRPGFKRFLIWCEKQECEIDIDDMNIEWRHKDVAAEALYDFLVLHTGDDAQILVERFEDNGPEAWRQLARRYDPIGESYVLDQMDKLMHVTRCKNMLELPSSISRWERAHSRCAELSGGKSMPEEWKLPILFRLIPQSDYDKIKLQYI